jgi:DNA processing protein
MSISSRDILLLQSLNGFGNAAIRRIVAELTQCNNCIDDLYEILVKLCNYRKIRPQLPTRDEMSLAADNADRIIKHSEDLGITMFTCVEDSFPSRLLKTVSEKGKPDVPVLVHCLGNLDVLGKPSLTVIGTRNPNDAGVKAAEFFSSEFASQGVNIVSGLAIGCDSIAHEAALSVNGSTTAILAGGLDSIYPKENRSLAERILCAGGLLVSENPVFTQTNKYNLVARDRIQAALGDATLVIQTGVKGGTMHAAKATLAADKPLLVVDYKDNSAEVIQGNLALKAIGAREISSSSWKEYKSSYLEMLARK